jgi:hypothetical protein
LLSCRDPDRSGGLTRQAERAKQQLLRRADAYRLREC